MDIPKDLQAAAEDLFVFLTRLYGDRFTPEMARELRGAVETVARTTAALKSVPMSRVGEPSLPFQPFRKEG